MIQALAVLCFAGCLFSSVVQAELTPFSNGDGPNDDFYVLNACSDVGLRYQVNPWSARFTGYNGEGEDREACFTVETNGPIAIGDSGRSEACNIRSLTYVMFQFGNVKKAPAGKFTVRGYEYNWSQLFSPYRAKVVAFADPPADHEKQSFPICMKLYPHYELSDLLDKGQDTITVTFMSSTTSKNMCCSKVQIPAYPVVIDPPFEPITPGNVLGEGFVDQAQNVGDDNIVDDNPVNDNTFDDTRNDEMRDVQDSVDDNPVDEDTEGGVWGGWWSQSRSSNRGWGNKKFLRKQL